MIALDFIMHNQTEKRREQLEIKYQYGACSGPWAIEVFSLLQSWIDKNQKALVPIEWEGEDSLQNKVVEKLGALMRLEGRVHHNTLRSLWSKGAHDIRAGFPARDIIFICHEYMLLGVQ